MDKKTGKSIIKSIILVVLSLLFALSCNNNFFYELIPADDNRISEFSVGDKQIGKSIIQDNNIIFQVGPDFDLDSVSNIKIEIDKNAVIIPITEEYIEKLLNTTDGFNSYLPIKKSTNTSDQSHDLNQLPKLIKDKIKANKKFYNNIEFYNSNKEFHINNRGFNTNKGSKTTLLQRKTTIAINFRQPVTFVVLSALGTPRIYTIGAVAIRLETFKFSKDKDNSITKDATGEIVHPTDQADGTITMTIPFYDNTNTANRIFIPDFTTYPTEAIVTINGTKIDPADRGVTSFEYKDAPNINTLVVTDPIADPEGLIKKTYKLTVNIGQSQECELKKFRFKQSDNTSLKEDVSGDIDQVAKTVLIIIPYNSLVNPNEDNTNFTATFEASTRATVKIGDTTTMISGETSFDYRNPQTLTVTAADGKTETKYKVTVIIGPYLKSFKFEKPPKNSLLSRDISGDVIQPATKGQFGTVTVFIPYDSLIDPKNANKNLIATFTASAGSTVKIGDTTIRSGENPSFNYSEPPKTLTVTAGATETKYKVTVTIEPYLTAFRFQNVYNSSLKDGTGNITGDIDHVTKTVTMEIHHDNLVNPANLTFVATFTIPNGVSLIMNGQTYSTSGRTSSITYIADTGKPLDVTAVDGDGTTRTYTVIVKILASSDCDLEVFDFKKSNNPSLKEDVKGVIHQTLHKVSVTIPFYSDYNNTNKKDFIATYAISSRATMAIEGLSTILTAANGVISLFDYINPDEYSSTRKITVTAANGLVSKEYELTVEVVRSPLCDLLTFDFTQEKNSTSLNAKVEGEIDPSNRTVFIYIPVGSNKNLTNRWFNADFTTSPDAKVYRINSLGNNEEVISGNNNIDFSHPVELTVVAQNESDRSAYTVTVKVEDEVPAWKLKEFWLQASGWNTQLKYDIRGEEFITIRESVLTKTGTVTINIPKAAISGYPYFSRYLYAYYDFNTESTAKIIITKSDGTTEEHTFKSNDGTTLNYADPVKMIITTKTGETFTYTITVNFGT